MNKDSIADYHEFQAVIAVDRDGTMSLWEKSSVLEWREQWGECTGVWVNNDAKKVLGYFIERLHEKYVFPYDNLYEIQKDYREKLKTVTVRRPVTLEEKLRYDITSIEDFDSYWLDYYLDIDDMSALREHLEDNIKKLSEIIGLMDKTEEEEKIDREIADIIGREIDKNKEDSEDEQIQTESES